MIQGWRPTSVTVQPASSATSPRGAEATSSLSVRGSVGTVFPPRHHRQPNSTATPIMAMPQPTMTWKAMWTTVTGGRSSRGNALRLRTSAAGSMNDRKDSPPGMSML